MNAFKVASLFAGCGGMDLGVQGGFRFNGKYYSRLNTEVVHASDFDSRVVNIYNMNFTHQSSLVDINNLKSKDLPKVDLVLGGFPCQSFSVVAQNPKRLGFKDEKGRLFFEMKRILEDKKPQAFIAENVKGLLSANKRQAFPLIIEEFEKAGYHVKFSLLNSSHFGVPQKRERVFIVGFRNKARFDKYEFPKPTTKDNPVPLGIFLDEDVDEKYFFSQRAVDGMKNTKNSEQMNKGRIQSVDAPCNTLGAHLAKASLNSTDPVLKIGRRYRMFTPREVSRIQSFPESFKLAVPKSHNYIALGNAVPPVLMWHVARSVLKVLE
ncbi:Dcm Site-specific DNA methylase [Candidatus Nanopelagicaceae bacterium]